MEIRDLAVDDDAELREWWEVEQAAHRHDRSHPVLRTWEALAFMVRNPPPHYRYQPLAAVDGGRVVGTADITLPQGENEHLAQLEICVRPEHRRRGIGRALHEEATRRRRTVGRTSALAELCTPVGGPDSPARAFARGLGYVDAHREHHLVLELPVGEDRLQALGASEPDGYDLLTWRNHCPDDLVDDYVTMRNRMASDAPLGDVDYVPPVVDRERVRAGEERLARAYDSVVAAARRRADGVLGGYSITFLAHGTDQAFQDDTLVMPDHRGHRLGLALKLATLRIVQRERPERTTYDTWTDPGNHAMYRTNERLGYRAVEEMLEVQVRD